MREWTATTDVPSEVVDGSFEARLGFYARKRSGFVVTNYEQVIRDVLLAQQPNKKFATVEELGALTVFLASDAANSITGIALPVDGGWTAH